MVQLAHLYIPTRKTIALTRWTFVGKVMSLLFNRLSRLVITFLPRSKHLLISWLQSPSSVFLEPPKIKSDTVSTVSPSISHKVMNSMKRQNGRILKEELPRSVGAQCVAADQWRNNSRENEGMEPKQKRYSVVGVTGDKSKVQCC